MQKQYIAMVVACRNANGSPDFFHCSVEASAQDVEEGRHYDMAEYLAANDGYGGPFLTFDDSETEAIEIAADQLRGAHRNAEPLRLCVHMDGGLIQGVVCRPGDHAQLRQMEFYSLDYDTEGADADRINLIRQIGESRSVEAIVGDIEKSSRPAIDLDDVFLTT